MSVDKRDEQTKKFLIGQYSTPEIEYLKDNDWVFTEKIDGTNIRIMWNGKDVVFGGHSDDAQIYTNLIIKLDELFKRMEPRQKFLETANAARALMGAGAMNANQGLDRLLTGAAEGGAYAESVIGGKGKSYIPSQNTTISGQPRTYGQWYGGNSNFQTEFDN